MMEKNGFLFPEDQEVVPPGTNKKKRAGPKKLKN